MDYKIKITTGLADTNRSERPHELLPNGYFPLGFMPRVGDTIVWNNLYWDVRSVVIDSAYREVTIWVKDSEHFKNEDDWVIEKEI